MIKHIAFDFDGTLADSQQCGLLATRYAFEKFELSIPDEETIASYMGIPIERSFREMAHQPLNADTLNALLATFRQRYQQLESRHLTTFPNIIQLLKSLQYRNITCSVISSKHSHALQRNLDFLKLTPYVTKYIGSDTVQHYKPHPEGLHIVMQHHHLAPTDLIMIGDAPADIEMGHAANIRTCAVTWGSHSREQMTKCHPTWLIDNPLELLDIIMQN